MGRLEDEADVHLSRHTDVAVVVAFHVSSFARGLTHDDDQRTLPEKNCQNYLRYATPIDRLTKKIYLVKSLPYAGIFWSFVSELRAIR